MPVASLASDLDDLLADIARRASGLQHPPLPRADRLDEPAVRLRWKRWLRFGGGHDWRVLRRRMRAEGLYPASLYQPRATGALPDWCDVLRDVIETCAGDVAVRLPAGGADAPFADLFAPCLDVARRRLAALGPGPAPTVFAPEALGGLERALLLRLAEIAGACLIRLFDEQREGGALDALFGNVLAADAPRDRHDAFVAALRADGMRPLFSRWPVLGRLVAVTISHWADAAHEVRQRAANDHAALRAELFAHADPTAAVTAIEATLSDAHAGGRTVLLLAFADGSRVVYKPRPMETEAAFSASVAWLNERLAASGAPVNRVPRVLPRGGYGWMEWIEVAPLEPGDEEAYHRRLGSLLALYRALNGTDMHHENLIAAAAYPVLVDVECVLHPRAMPLADMPSADPPMLPGEVRALVQSGALPFYGFDPQTGQMQNHGAIARDPGTAGPAVPTFIHPNTDRVALRRVPAPAVTQHHPRTEAGWVDCLAHRKAIAAGYGAALRLIVADRAWLLGSPESPWQSLRRAHGRHLARNTWNYGLLLRAATGPEALADGVMFDLTFEALHRALGRFSPGFRAMAIAERAALRDLDVPRMGYAADDVMGRGPRGEVLAAMSQEPPWATMEAGLRGIEDAHIDRETAAIELLLRPVEPRAIAGSHPVAWLRSSLDALCGNAVADARSMPGWYTLQQTSGGVAGGPAGTGLYDGSSGIAFALAAAARALGDAGLARMARATLALPTDVLRCSAAAGGATPDFVGPGFDKGRAGILFALHACARMQGDATLAATARTLATDWIATPGFARCVQDDRGLDLMNGAGGLLLVLLELARDGENHAALLAGARACGDHLLARARRDGDAIWWGVGRSAGLSGLSHGGAGFAAALAALYRATGHRPYREAAFAALRHESRLFHPGLGNWRDMRGANRADPAGVNACGCSWCHGAPGIALGRAAMLGLLEADLSTDERGRLRRDLDVALQTLRTALAGDANIDDLCCGTAGRIDILLECARLLGRSDLATEARQCAERCIARWQEVGQGGPRYWWAPHAVTTGDASLFKGTAGWVYLAARLSAPHEVPCVLLPLPAP